MIRLMCMGCVLCLASGCGSTSPGDTDAGDMMGSDAGDMMGSDAGPADGCWQAASIPDLSAMGNAGSAYPAPEASASCVGDEVVMTANGIPTFEYVAITPNGLDAQDYTWRFPSSPARAARTTEVPLLGPAAVTVTGLPIFGPTENPMDGYRDPFLDDQLRNLLDECNGHTAPRGVYHFHARPECIVTSLGGEAYGLVLGFAFDGYPILAPLVCTDSSCSSTRRVQSSWRLTLSEYTVATRDAAWDIHEYVEGLGDLDECNGLAIDDPSAPYDYAYFATDSFPYFMGCYRGTPTSNGPAGGGGRP